MTAALIERLEKAEAGSGELDGDVAEATVGFMEWDGTPVTTSLDAALALAERVLPGQRITLVIGRLPGACISEKYDVEAEQASAFAPTPALALCIAVLKATTANAVGTTEGRAPILSPETNEQTPVTQKGGA